MTRWIYVWIATVFCLALAGLVRATEPAQTAAGQMKLDIPAQPIGDALNELGRQSGLHVVLYSGLGKGIVSPRLSGTYSVQAALEHLLANTDLRYEYLDAQTVAILAKGDASPSDSTWSGQTSSSVDGGDSGQVHLAQAADAPSDAPAGNDAAQPQQQTLELEEVVVTGTHIRGRSDSAAPLLVITRDDIDRTGAGTVADYITKHVPQNLANASEGTMGSLVGGGDSFNVVQGAAVNLRGLGSDATLVLLNGRRLAPGNLGGNFVDISLIPLAALERVDVMTGGSSAIYGSDAVGGVVNFITRKDFQGSETRARYGAVENGGRREISAGQTFGSRWNGGSALLSYEYFDATPLDAADRSYTSTAGQPTNLFPPQRRHAAFFTAEHQINADFDVFTDATFAKRSSESAATNDFFSQRSPIETEALSVALGGRLRLPASSELEVVAIHADSEALLSTFDLPANSLAGRSKTDTKVASIDAKLDGTLWKMGARSIRYAVGAQYRDESLRFRDLFAAPIDPSRNVLAGFAEVQIPLLPGDEPGSPERLSLSLAERTEHYSDFGSSNNPQLGVIWQPLSALKVRGTFGKSFQAPLLVQLAPRVDSAFPIAIFDPLSAGAQAGKTTCDFLAPDDACTNVIEVFGGSRGDLKPQTSTSWTLGLDFTPRSMPGWRASLSYYHIKFKDRIVDPSGAVDSLLALESEEILGPSIIARDPSAAAIAALVADPAFSNPLGVDLDAIGVVIDARTRNLSIVKTSGIDLGISTDIATSLGELDIGLDATYILELENQFTATSPAVTIDDTPYNPADLNLRAHAGVTRGPFTATLFVNYVDAYEDKRGLTTLPISSWTTADLTVGYRTAAEAGVLSNASVSLTVTNLADKDPPFVTNTSTFNTLNFDGVNANALGRFFSMQLSKRF